MVRNYLKVALRNIRKYKFFSAINILGMTIGVTACLLIIVYIADELSYDRFHQHIDRMYQVGLHGKIAGQEIRTANTCPPLSRALVDEVPDVEASTRLANFFGPVVKYEDLSFTEERVFFADSNFFSFFSFELLEGDALHVLREPNTVVLTQSMATKYFGQEPAIGKLITMGGDNKTYKVTGVAADCPENSHFRFNMLVSSASSERLQGDIWLNNYLYTYFILKDKGSVENVESRMAELVVKYVGPEVERFMGVSLDKMKEQGGVYGFFPTRVADIRLHSTTRDSIEPTGNIEYIYFFGAIAILIIVIACINFMNLATARSAGRAKEVGLRKALGSYRTQLVGQFLSESFIFSFIAVVLAVVSAYLLLPYFNLLAGKNMSMDMLYSPYMIVGIVGLILVVSMLAGSYPAFYLTSFQAVEVLKGKIKSGMKSRGIRSAMVVFQFGISIFLIIFTATVYLQINYMQDRNLGMDKHNILIVQNTYRLGNNREAYKTAIEQQSGIVKTSFTNNTFPGVNNTTVFKSVGAEQDHIMGQYYADYDHLDVIKFELKEGRYFSPDFLSDSTAIILNEAAVKEFGMENPLSEEILFNAEQPERLRVIGVLKDFNFESLKEQIRPLAIRLGKFGGNLMIRYSGSSAEVLETAQRLWKENSNNEPFEYTFLDEDFDELFRAEQRLGMIFTILSGLAIFVACLGLFALAAFTAEQRTKEIGIRKAMGASVSNLIYLLSREFAILVLIAFVPGALCAWWVVDSWLAGFAYRIDLNPVLFVLCGVITLAIAILTVSYQSIKAAAANPVNSLRYE